MSAFEQMLKLEHQMPEDPTTALVHVRAMGVRLGELATLAADEKYPGFQALCSRLFAKELELLSQVADT